MTSDEQERPPRNRQRDIWQLHIPLVLVLTLCTTLTVIEVSRAADGNWRSWVYSFEWPAIGAFAIWMWYRFRTEGNPVKGITRRWNERVQKYQDEAAADESQKDPQAQAWQAYVDDLHRREPPGQG